MHVWILKASEPTPYDARMRGSRLFRYGMFAQRAVELGHEVLWWTDDFDHFHKEHRFGEDRLVDVMPGCEVQFVHTPGYRQNSSPRRFRDHRILAERIERMADAHARPDVIVAGMPSDHLCVSAVRLGARYSVPVVLDVRDLWPDVFYQQVPAALRPLLWLLVRPFARRVRWAFSRADGIIGNTEQFVRWGLDKADRPWSPRDRVVPIGYRRPELTRSRIQRAQEFWDAHGIRPDDGVFTVCFFGSIGPMYDFEPVLHAARLLVQDDNRVRFVLCGQGNQLDTLRSEASGLENVVLPGWVNADQSWTLMQMSKLGLAPYRDDPNFRNNVPNKPAEYLAAALPFLVSIEGAMHDLVQRNQCGGRYGSGEQLAQLIRAYRDSPDRLSRERSNAERLFNEQLNAEVVYSQLIDHLESLIADMSECGGQVSSTGVAGSGAAAGAGQTMPEACA